MNKTQKIVILAALMLILFSIMYPPYLMIRDLGLADKVIGGGWNWIFKMGPEIIEKEDITFTEYSKVRLDILICEISGIIIMAGFFILLFKKKR